MKLIDLLLSVDIVENTDTYGVANQLGFFDSVNCQHRSYFVNDCGLDLTVYQGCNCI